MLGAVLGVWASPAPGSAARSSKFACLCQVTWWESWLSDQGTREARPGTKPHPRKDESIKLLNEGRNRLFERRVMAHVTHGEVSWLREVSGPTRAIIAMLSWVGLSLGQQPNCSIPLLTLFLLFFREPIGKKRSGKDSFPLRQFHQLLLLPTTVVSWNGARVWPHGKPASGCVPPQGSPTQCAPSVHLRFHCSLQVLTSGPPAVLPKVGQTPAALCAALATLFAR